MGDKTNIPWTDATWNPMSGCSKVSEGCDNCYAEAMSRRLRAMGQGRYKNAFRVTEHGKDEELMSQPTRWKRPRMVFVCSMGDLFHEHVTEGFITKVYTEMVVANHHVFQVLTKRADRMQQIITSMRGVFGEENLRHIWHGVSIENKYAWRRLDALQRTPSSVRFVSFEPLLGEIPSTGLFGLDWVIIGGESGAKARPIPLEQAKNIVDQCEMYGVKCFVKQLGTHWAKKNGSTTSKGSDIKEWPVWARVQEFPACSIT